jgi:hypothetical protein
VAGAVVVAASLVPAGAAAAQQLTYTYSTASQGAVQSSVGGFADMVRATLADDRGWNLGGAVSFVEVSSGADFRVVLASPAVVDEAGQVCSERYSCRVGSDLLINDENWAAATPAWPLSLAEYRHMVLNHELGHWMGFGHAECPGAGQPAPVMQQQSIQVEPCLANPWPLPSERHELAARLGVRVGGEHPQEELRTHGGPARVRPDGVLRSGPDAAAVRGFERVDVVVQGTDGYYWTHWTGSSWTGWRGLGPPPGGLVDGSRASVASWAPGRLDVFARGGDGDLWQRFSVDGGASWSTWIRPVGDDGDLASAPHVNVLSGQRLDVYVLGTDGQVWERYWDGTAWNPGWIPHGAPAPGVVGPPTSVSHDGNQVDVFVRGGDDRLWQRHWDGSDWSQWFRPVGDAGTLDSPPDAASWSPGTVLVAVRGTDGGIWVLSRGAVWGEWARLGGAHDRIIGSPGAASRGFERFDVFGRGTDDLLYQVWV